MTDLIQTLENFFSASIQNQQQRDQFQDYWLSFKTLLSQAPLNQERINDFLAKVDSELKIPQNKLQKSPYENMKQPLTYLEKTTSESYSNAKTTNLSHPSMSRQSSY